MSENSCEAYVHAGKKEKERKGEGETVCCAPSLLASELHVRWRGDRERGGSPRVSNVRSAIIGVVELQVQYEMKRSVIIGVVAATVHWSPRLRGERGNNIRVSRAQTLARPARSRRIRKEEIYFI